MYTQTAYLPTNSKALESLLTRHKLSVTEPRKQVLGDFLMSDSALCHADIEKRYALLDRVTIYRTLQAFLKKGLIHIIPSTDDVVRYALCKDACTEHHHVDNHVHFFCTQCKKTTCMTDMATPTVKVPQRVSISEVQVLIKGLCTFCSV